MTDQANDAGRPKRSMTYPDTSGGWEKKPYTEQVRATLLWPSLQAMHLLTYHTQKANNQALASETCSEAFQRWLQEPNDVAPWNAIQSFRPTASAKMENASRGKASTNGATTGSKTSISDK